MEQESFENNTIAELLNREYICVKVDREERPDVDAVYMSVCQAMNGQGGWPLTIIMTPACRPFFSGTYLPPKARYGRVGLEELLTAVAGQWKTNRGKLLDSAGRIEAYLKEQERATVSAEPGMDLVHQAFRQFAGNFDKKNGGFGGAPKFPKMKTQLKNRFAIKLTLEQISGTLACPTLLSTIVQVSDNPSKR